VFNRGFFSFQFDPQENKTRERDDRDDRTSLTMKGFAKTSRPLLAFLEPRCLGQRCGRFAMVMMAEPVASRQAIAKAFIGLCFQ